MHGPFERPLRDLYALAALLCAALLLAALAWWREALLAPGPLPQGHATLHGECQRCHSAPFPRLRAGDARAAARQRNRDCLRCHQRTIGHSAQTFTAAHHERAPGDDRPCAACHPQHRGDAPVEDRACVGCHRDLRAVQPQVAVAERIGGFDASDAAPHPEFRWHRERRPDPGVLRFNHQRHLRDRLPGPDGAPVLLGCQDCHRPAGLAAPWRFGARRAAAAAEPLTALPRGEHMAPIAYADHCAGCHPLRPPGAALRGDDAVGRGEVPHSPPAAVRTYLRGQLAGAAPPQGAAEALAALERGLYQAPGQGCGKCHSLTADATRPGALPSVVPPRLPPRFFPRARFDHARHGAAALGGYAAEGLPDCLACHARAVESTRTADVLLPTIADCRRCHGPPSGRGAAARGGAPARCSTCHGYHVPPPQALGPDPAAAGPGAVAPALIRAGFRETREGLRRAMPRWPLSAFFALPARAWGLPDLQPGSAAFRRELFQRYGLFPADFPNDGLPLGLLRTEQAIDGEPGLVVTCELCHSSSLFGRIVVGQPNPFVDIDRLWDDLDRLGGKSFDNGLYYKTPVGNTVVNGADQLGLLGMTLRNPDLSIDPARLLRFLTKASQDLRPEFAALAYLKTPSWYNYRLRVEGASGLYADGGQPKDGNFAAYTYMASFYDRDGQDLAAALAAWQRSGHAFLASVAAPRYPFPIRAALLPRGRALYLELCARCHGRYAATGAAEATSFPGLVLPAAEVGTDPKRAAFPASFARRTRQILKEEYALTGGYAAPPLLGIWARAPYLHNGSVPTLEELLDPPRRRAGYVLVADPDDPADFDAARVGWRCAPLRPGDPPAHRAYDPSRLPGLSNAGHRYGAELDGAGRAALIEYLKTL